MDVFHISIIPAPAVWPTATAPYLDSTLGPGRRGTTRGTLSFSRAGRGRMPFACRPLVAFGRGRPTVAHLNCSSTNHFLSLREQFLKWPGASGGWPVGVGKFQWPGPPQLPFCEPENVRFRLRFIFLAVTA